MKISGFWKYNTKRMKPTNTESEWEGPWVEDGTEQHVFAEVNQLQKIIRYLINDAGHLAAAVLLCQWGCTCERRLPHIIGETRKGKHT